MDTALFAVVCDASDTLYTKCLAFDLDLICFHGLLNRTIDVAQWASIPACYV